MHSGVSVPAGGGGDYIEVYITNPASTTIYLAGSGSVDINWGEGTIQPVTLNASATSYAHAAETVIRVSNPNNLTHLYALNNSNIYNIVVPASAVNMYWMFLSGNSLTSFTTHPEWVSLGALGMGSNSGLTSFETHPEWISIYSIGMEGTGISSFETHSEWVNLKTLHLQDTNISSVTCYSTWTVMDELAVSNTSVSSITTYDTWTVFYRLLAGGCTSLTSVTLHPEFTGMASLYLHGCSNLTTLTVYDTWNAMLLLTLSDCAFTETAVNNILIEMDNSSISNTAEIALQGGTNAAPTGAGITAKNSLIAKGILVQTN